MKLTELVEALGLEVRSSSENLFKKEVTGGYASDLLSDVIGNSREGNLWITLQSHLNIVAVASMKELSGIILIGGREPDEDTIQKAESEKMPIMVSKLPAFELIGRLYDLGVRGIRTKNVIKS